MTSPYTAPYWNYRDEISIYDGIMFKGEKVIVPKSMQREMLTLIHSSHLGVEKCKRRARDVLYWPRMNAEIEDAVSKCQVCSTTERVTKENRCSHTQSPKDLGSELEQIYLN